MNNVERRIINSIEKKKWFLFVAIVSLLGGVIRYCGKDFLSGDVSFFLIPWIEEFKNTGGLAALSDQIGDYNIPYQIILALLSYLPFEPLYMIKAVSVVFDFFLSIMVAKLIYVLTKSESKAAFSYAVVLFLPTNIMNSSVWGQCDSIYVSFVICSLYYLVRNCFKTSFVFLGIAFAFKLQTIFIVPVFVYYYFIEKKYSILYFGLVLLVDYVLCIPAFIFGRSFTAPLSIYFSQTTAYQYMWLNFPSYWTILGNYYEILKMISIIFTVFVLGCGLMYLMHKKIILNSSKNLLLISAFVVWTCIIFLPSMHERYSYLLDILLCCIVILNPAYIIFFLASNIISTMTYGAYLFGTSVNQIVSAIVYFVSYIFFTGIIFKIIGRDLDDSCITKYRIVKENKS